TRAQRKNLIDAIPKNEIKLIGKSADDLKNVTVAENRIQTVRAGLEKNNSETGIIQKKNNLITTLGNARQQYALAIKKLETEQPGLRFTVRPTDLLKMQEYISPSEAIISYLITRDKLYIFVVSRNAVVVRPV